MKAPGNGPHLYLTYFDSAYLARGIVMLRSLRRHHPAAEVLVLALDDLCARVLAGQFGGGLRVIGTETLHRQVPVLEAIRQQRSAWAYYATLKPILALFALEREPAPGSVMFVDADTWFFGELAPVFEEIGGASLALSPHRFQAATAHLAIYGQYNAGCIYWRNDDTARRCLADWRDECLEWCGEEPQPDGRFMNQGYLNQWPERYHGVHVLRHPGANLAPWNVDGHLLTCDGGSILVDGWPLLFYHFHGLCRDAEGQWYSYFPHLGRQFDLARKTIYLPYLEAVDAESRRLLETHGIDGVGSVRQTADWPVAVRFSDAAPGTTT